MVDESTIAPCVDGANTVIFLTCTAHGKPAWVFRLEDLPDRSVSVSPPVRRVDLYEVEQLDIDLDDPTTWSTNPCWNRDYADKGIYPQDWTEE